MSKKPAVRAIKTIGKPGKKVVSNVRYRRGFVPRDFPTYSGVSIAHAYNCPTGMTGSAIAIIEYGGGWNQADVDQAAVLANCPVPNITDVNAGLTNSPGGDADDEVALDIQAAMGVISYMTGKAADIYMIWADSQQDALDAIANLIDSGVPIGAISVSWGSDEGDGDEQSDSDGIKAFTQKYGIPFCCATGDNDDGSGSTVDEPADSPYAVGVSGTTKTNTAEYVWNAGSGEGTGGGESDIFPMPAYQQGVIPSPASGSWRTTGDVACIGDPNTGLNTVVDGQVQPIGGTSLATPIFAAIIAGMGPLPKLAWPDCLYAAKSAFVQVTEGNNSPTGSGNWPGTICCGLGVPNGTLLYNALSATNPTPPSPPIPVPPSPPVPVPPSPPSPPTPIPPPPVPPSPPVTATLTGTATGTLEGTGPLHPTQTINLTITGNVAIPSSGSPGSPTFPNAVDLASRTAKLRPKSISTTQWLQILEAILTALEQILGGITTNPTPTTLAPQLATLPGIARFKPTSMTGSQWLQLIIQILLEILPIFLGSGA
jgi:Subtilase family